jgi:hypothetical protein
VRRALTPLSHPIAWNSKCKDGMSKLYAIAFYKPAVISLFLMRYGKNAVLSLIDGPLWNEQFLK